MLPSLACSRRSRSRTADTSRDGRNPKTQCWPLSCNKCCSHQTNSLLTSAGLSIPAPIFEAIVSSFSRSHCCSISSFLHFLLLLAPSRNSLLSLSRDRWEPFAWYHWQHLSVGGDSYTKQHFHPKNFSVINFLLSPTCFSREQYETCHWDESRRIHQQHTWRFGSIPIGGRF